jgi:hypothetical protein
LDGQNEDHAYGEDYNEDPNPRRRDKFIFVAAVLGLALLCGGGSFALCTLLADSIVPPLLSIITAESNPIKVIKTSLPPQSDADKAGSDGEERPVDVPPPVSTAPQPMSTVPIFPESAPAPGPDGASVSPPTPLAQPAPVARVDSLNSPTAVPAPSIPSENQAAAPDAPTPHNGFADKAGTEKDPHRLDTDGSAERGRLHGESAAERPYTACNSTASHQAVRSECTALDCALVE